MKLILTILLVSVQVMHCLGQNFSDAVKEFIIYPEGNYAIRNVLLVDGTGGPVQPGQNILIAGNKIISIGSDNTIPDGYQVIEGSGKTLIPGLVMLHEHLFYTRPSFEKWFSVAQMPFTFPRLYLAGGVTTMRTGGSVQPDADLNIKKWIAQGLMTGPRIHVTSPHLTREGISVPSLGVIENSEQMGQTVNFWADRGITSFKVYTTITREDLRVCVREAHKRGFKVTGHLCSVSYREAADIGIDNLEHGFMASSDFQPDKPLDQCDYFDSRQALSAEDLDGDNINALIDHLIEKGTAITTTPNVFEPYTEREIVPGGGFKALTQDYQLAVQRRYESMVNNDANAATLFHKNMKWLKRFYDKGGHLIAGTDPTGAGRTVAGYANQRTVELLVEEGFLLEDAIKICTLNGAKFLEVDDQVGTIAVGKTADIVLIDGEITKDIRLIRNNKVVFKDGIGFDSEKMFESVNGKVGLY